MPCHLFLTGDVQVGKSTLIRRFLQDLSIPIGGFRTISGPSTDNSFPLHLVSASQDDPIISSRNCVAVRHGYGCPNGCTVYPEVFDSLGCMYLREAKKYPLILMDELGFFEKDALLFQDAVFSLLNGSVPILGVVRDRRAPFLDSVRSHPNVTIIRVTLENRDLLYPTIFSELKKKVT